MQQSIAHRKAITFPPTAFPIIHVSRMNVAMQFGMTVLGS